MASIRACTLKLFLAKIGGIVVPLRQAQAGALRLNIDDLRLPALLADDPLDIGRRIVRPLEDCADDLGVVSGTGPAHGEPHALILAELAGEVLQQHIVEQGHVLLLLLRGALFQ